MDELFAAARRAAPFAELPRAVFDGVLEMLAGRYPSDAFAQLRPRVVWDRARGTVRAREGAGRIGDHERRHDRRPGPVRRVHHRWIARRRARRGVRLRVAARRGHAARRDVVADRGHHPRPGDRTARAGRAREAAVLEGAGTRPPGRARPGDRRFTRALQERAERGAVRRCRTISTWTRAAATSSATSRAGERERRAG